MVVPNFYFSRMCCEILLTDKSPLVRKNVFGEYVS